MCLLRQDRTWSVLMNSETQVLSCMFSSIFPIEQIPCINIWMVRWKSGCGEWKCTRMQDIMCAHQCRITVHIPSLNGSVSCMEWVLCVAVICVYLDNSADFHVLHIVACVMLCLCWCWLLLAFILFFFPFFFWGGGHIIWHLAALLCQVHFIMLNHSNSFYAMFPCGVLYEHKWQLSSSRVNKQPLWCWWDS